MTTGMLAAQHKELALNVSSGKMGRHCICVNGVQFSRQCAGSCLNGPLWAECWGLTGPPGNGHLALVHTFTLMGYSRDFPETRQPSWRDWEHAVPICLGLFLPPAAGPRHSLLAKSLCSRGRLGPQPPAGLTVLDIRLAGLQVSRQGRHTEHGEAWMPSVLITPNSPP